MGCVVLAERGEFPGLSRESVLETSDDSREIEGARHDEERERERDAKIVR
jgi:hypothetical protein